MAASIVVLDLDGTVWDSFPVYAQALEQERGIPRRDTLQRLRDGENIVRLITDAGLQRTPFANAAAEIAGSEMLYDGIEDSLRHLSKQGVPLGVFTSLPGTIALPILKALDLPRFVEVIHAGSRVRPKPHPEGILRVIQTAGLRPDANAFFVGDLEHDSLAAQRAGVSFAWASYGYGHGAPAYVTKRLDHAKALRDL